MGTDEEVPGSASLEDKADHCRLTLDWEGLLSVSEKFGDAAPTRANTLRAEALLELNDFKKAEKCVNTALTLTPDCDDALIIMARLQLRKHCPSQALEYAKKVKVPSITQQVMEDAANSKLAERLLRKQLEAEAIRAQCCGYLDQTENALNGALGVLEHVNRFYRGQIPHEKSLFKHVLNEVVVAIGPVPMATPNYDFRIEWLRDKLQANRHETSLTRVYLLRSLGRILLATCQAEYKPIKASQNKVYTPLTHSEEASLALQLVEEYYQTLVEYDVDETIYDELVLSLAMSAQPSSVIATMERGVTRCRHPLKLWSQLARALAISGRHGNALTALQECVTLTEGKDATYLIRAAEMCIYHLGETKQGVDYAERGYQMAVLYETARDQSPDKTHLPNPSGAEPSSTHALGVLGAALALNALSVPSLSERKDLQRAALDCLKRACAADPTNPQLSFNLACHLANIREIKQAAAILSTVIYTLDTNPNVWLMFILTLTAARRYGEALAACRKAAVEHPKNYKLQLLMGRLKAHVEGVDAAVEYYDELFSLLDKHERHAPAVQVNTRLEKVRAVLRGAGDLDDARKELESLIRIETTDSEALGNLHHYRGRYEEARGDLTAAMEHYQSSLAHNVNQVHSLVASARVHATLGNADLALTYARSATRAEPTAHKAWFHAGTLFAATGQVEAGADALMIAAELEMSAPIAQFSWVDWDPYCC